MQSAAIKSPPIHVWPGGQGADARNLKSSASYILGYKEEYKET